ncbi:MAG TPA: DUF4112 domain-containing protein [Burkholderiales bacterium]|nr:DUF4112 domain-containing protein [Burkholderiales bacterium]
MNRRAPPEPQSSGEPEVLTPAEFEARERLQKLAWLLDSSIPIPGTRFTIGVEALLGLFPVLGDLAGVLLSSYIVSEAARLGASKSILARMTFNVVVEGLAGMVPFAGDIFDAAYKANQRNVRLLNDYLADPRRTRRASTKFFLLMALVILAVMGLIGGAGFLLWKLLSG